MRVRLLFFTVCLFCLVQSARGQIDSVPHRLETVGVSADRTHSPVNATSSLQVLKSREISNLPALNVSDVLKTFAGLVIRDYGGVGGMKTVAMRGFGSQHTAVSYDGLAVSDCQTGQIDLSKFSLGNVEQISVNSGTPDDIFLPARLMASASLIRIQTLRPTFRENKPVNLDFHFTGGSFGLWNPSLLIENKIYQKKDVGYPFVYSSVSASYLQSDGRYPFLIRYGGDGDSTSMEKRTNSDVRTASVEGNLFTDFNSHSRLNVKLYYYWSDRGLPGAVIFYNTHSKERLTDHNAFGQVHYENRFSAKFAYQVNAKFNFAQQRYLNPEYLNAAGFLDNVYIQREWYLSNTFLYAPHRVISLSLSNDLIFGNMSANLYDFVYPSRLQVLTMLSAFVSVRHVDIRAGLLHTGVANWAAAGEAGKNLSWFSPSVGISVQPMLSEAFHLRAFYKNIFRLPTFNDLYYTEVGNRNLRPEDTHQFDIGASYAKSFLKNTIRLTLTADGYYNLVKDKIVAIPNKNLFVWTMLNFGKVEIDGVDANATFQYQIVKDLSVSLSGSYTYQRAVDKTDPASKTYLHQIPYTPLHSGSVSVMLSTTWFEVGYTMVAAGKRYALQQNVAANELAPYTDHSLTLGHDFDIKGKVTLGLKAELLNLANLHYEIIRNYPMQGRSVRATVRLKW